jgi:parallel beta-helix repeat protein
MQLPRRLYPFVTLLILVALFVGLAITVLVPKVSHAVQPQVDNGLVGWPFVPSEASWKISYGYDAPYPSDHNCGPGGICHERYGFDFFATNRTTGGLTVKSPASGSVYAWPGQASDGSDCFAISLGNHMYVMVCHIILNNKSLSSVNRGDIVGTVHSDIRPTYDNSHIHMNLFYSTDPNLNSRTGVPFADPWMIQGCNYPLAPGETADPNYRYPPQGYHYGETVPCGNQGGTPNLTIHWGNNSFPGNGIYLNRPVLVEVRNTFSNTDLFKQKVTTDSNGTATLALTGIIPGYYTVMLKPDGFLRQSTNMTLQAGANTVSLPMTVSGIDCNSGQPTGPQLWIGDVNNDNVINTADYNIILAYFGKTIPPQFADLDGDPTHTYSGVDYNSWLRSICYFGGGKGFVDGVGGVIDNMSPSTSHNTPVLTHIPPVVKTTRHTPTTPVLKQTPVATPRSEHAPTQQRLPATHVVQPSTKQKLHTMSGSGTLSMSPATGSYRVSQSFTVTIQGDSGGLALNGTDMVIHYDPLVLSVTSITPGTIFPSTPVHANDPSIGEIHISSNATSQPIVVSGTLATIQFTVIGSGQTNVTFDYNSSSNARSDMSQSGNTGQVLGSVLNATFTVGILHVPQDYSTITSALSAANSAETVLVAPGTYHEQFYVPSGVILQGQDRDTTIIDGDAVANQAVIYLGNGSTISGFTVQNSGTDFYDAAVWADQGPVTITNMRLMHNSMGIVRYCFTTPCPGNSTISNNIVIHNTYTGILVHAVEALVQNNTVIDNQLQGITFEADGSQGMCVGNIIAYNMRGLSATSATTLVNNQLWQNNPNYDPSTIPGSSDVIADPLFLNASSSDYRLHAVSPAVQSGVAIGAYPFTPSGTTPTNLSVTQSVAGVTVSWQTNGQASGYAVSYTQGSNPFFSQTVDAGNNSSYTFPFSQLSGPVTFGVSSYDGQHNESFAGYVQVTVASMTLNHGSGSYNQTITATGSGFGNGELLNIYLDTSGNFPLASTSTDATGNFSTQFTIPQAVGGAHTIVAQGFTSGIVSTTPLYIYSSAKLQHTQGKQGSQNSITGYGFTANENVLAYWSTGNTSTLLGTSTANVLGTSTLTFTTLVKPAGTYSLYLVGQTSGNDAFTSFKIIQGLSITPTSGAHGSNATITGTGYRANEMVTVKWDCGSATCTSTTTLVTVKANGSGNFTITVQIPTGASIGKHTIGGIGQTSKKFASTIYKVTS